MGLTPGSRPVRVEPLQEPTIPEPKPEREPVEQPKPEPVPA